MLHNYLYCSWLLYKIHPQKPGEPVATKIIIIIFSVYNITQVYLR